MPKMPKASGLTNGRESAGRDGPRSGDGRRSGGISDTTRGAFARINQKY